MEMVVKMMRYLLTMDVLVIAEVRNIPIAQIKSLLHNLHPIFVLLKIPINGYSSLMNAKLAFKKTI